MIAAAGVRTAHRVLQFDLHGLALRIECADPAVLVGVEQRLANLVRSPRRDADLVVSYGDGPPHSRPAGARVVYASPAAEAVYSAADDTFYAFHELGATMRCAPSLGRAEIAAPTGPADLSWVLTRPLLTLAIMELVRRRGLYPLHAACLAQGEDGVLVCGPSGSGKSTLTLALLERGLGFLGDDLVFLREEDGRLDALGFPDEIGLTANARDVVPSLPARVDLEPRRGWPKARADVGEIAPHARLQRSCRPRLVVSLDGADDAAFETLTPDSGLVGLLPSILLTHPGACAGHLSALAKLTTSATLLRTASRPDPRAVVDLVVATLSRLNDLGKDSR